MLWLYYACTKRRRAGERLLVGHGGGKESKRKTENELYGCNQSRDGAKAGISDEIF